MWLLISPTTATIGSLEQQQETLKTKQLAVHQIKYLAFEWSEKYFMTLKLFSFFDFVTCLIISPPAVRVGDNTSYEI